MAGVKRTSSCVNCGGVIFKVKQSTGGVIFCCEECGNELNEVKCDKYQTLSQSCGKCGSESFKVRIIPDKEDNRKEHWAPECTSCEGAPKLVYIDNKGNLINEDERNLLIMEDSIRKAKCEKCGSITFKIKQRVGGVVYHCTDCNNELDEIEYDKYETLLPSCRECGGETFKVVIEQDEEDDTTDIWSPVCINCKGTPRSVFVNEEGKLITKTERIILIMKDRIEELENEVESNNETIIDLESEIEELNYTIEEKESRIYHQQKELGDTNRTISNLRYNVSDLEWKIGRLED